MSSASWTRTKTARNAAPQGSVLRTVEQESFTKSGSNTPNFEAKVRLGQQLPMNAYTLTHNTTLDHFTPVLIRQWNGSRTSYTIAYGGQPLLYQQANFAQQYTVQIPVFTSTAVVEEQAKAKFWDNASKNRDDFGLMVAESRKTANLVTTTAVRLATAFKKLRRRDVWGAYQALNMRYDNRGKALSRASRGLSNDAATHSRFAASSFLEMQYGWKPLLSDVFTSAERLAYRNQKQDFDVVIRGSAASEAPYTYGVGSSFIGTSYPYSFRALPVGENRRAVRVAYACRYRVVNPALRVASCLGLTNPLLLAWELLPFSFVVDWFAPIGNYFESMSALQGLAYRGGVKSTKVTVDRSILFTGECSISGSTLQQAVVQGVGTYELHQHSFTRVSTAAPSRPGPFALNPGAMGSDRPLKALALLRSVIRK